MFIFPTKEKQCNLCFAVLCDLGGATMQGLQRSCLRKNDEFWERQLRAQGSSPPGVLCFLMLEARAPTTAEPFLWKISISCTIHVLQKPSPSSSSEEENSRRVRDFAPANAA